METTGADGRADRVLGPRARLALQVGLFVVPVALVIVAALFKRLTVDDGFIYFRVVDQVLAGNGPVFNPGERVEAFTSPAWLAGLVLGKALFGWLGRLEVIAVGFGLLCTAVGLGSALGASRELALLSAGTPVRPRRASKAGGATADTDTDADPDADADADADAPTTDDDASATGLLVPVGIWAVVAFPPTWHWATSGLDTSLFVAWIGVSSWLLLRWARASIIGAPPRRSVVWTTAVVVGSGWLVRPDAMLFTLVFLAVLAAGTKGWSRRLTVVAIGLAPSAAYQVFRMGYYGALVSNTSLAKEGLASDWGSGWRYLTSTAGRYALWFAVLALAGATVLALRPLWLARSERGSAPTRLAFAAALAPVVGGLAHFVWVAKVGGDYLEGRFVLPGLFALTIPSACLPLRTFGVAVPGEARTPEEARPVRIGAAAVGVVLVLLTVRGMTTGRAFQPDPIDGDPSYTFLTNARNPTMLSDYPVLAAYGQALGKRADAGQHVLVKATTGKPGKEPVVPTDEGVVGFFGSIGAGAYAAPLDAIIVDERGLSDAFGGRLRAKPGVPGHEKRMPWSLAVARYGATDAPLDPAAASARQALECGQLKELVDATTAPMTPSRFLSNLVHAPALTNLRLPSNLDDLAAVYCR